MSEFDPISARGNSWRQVEKAGLRRNADLPLLEIELQLQPVRVIADRLLCMAAVAAHAFGLPLASTRKWLDQEHLIAALSPREQEFISGAKQYLLSSQMQVHSVYALAWCTSVVDEFSVNQKMPDDFVRQLPDFKHFENASAFRSRLVLRPRSEVLAQLDAAYCFHWAWRDANLSSDRNLSTNNMLVVAERRKALEWAFRDGNWDDISLDT